MHHPGTKSDFCDLGFWALFYIGGTSQDIPGTSRGIPGCKGIFETWDVGIVLGGTSQDIPGTSRDIPGCEGTFETWDIGHCSR